MHKYVLGGFAALTLLAVVACGGGQGTPGAPFPTVSGIGSGSLSTSLQSITLPQSSGLGVGAVGVTGTGAVSASQSVSNPSAVPVLQLRRRSSNSTSAAASANTPVGYVTVTATSASTLSLVSLQIAPTATIPTGTYYVAFWNGSQWVTIGKAATISGGVINVSTGSITPPVALTTGSSYYLAVYTGQIFSTPTPPPPAPVASPASLTLSEGQTGQLAVTSGSNITITATSSDTSIATVTASANTGSGTTATFTVTALLAVGTSTITFTDPLGHTGTALVTVNNTAPTPQPNPESATISLGDVASVGISAKPSTVITITSADATVATVSTSSSGSGASASTTVTTDGTGNGTFYVVGVAGGVTSISLADTFSNVGTMPITVSAVKNGSFSSVTSGIPNNWTPCSYAHAELAEGGVNSTLPLPYTPNYSQGSSTTPAITSGLTALVAAVTPPPNDNPGYPLAGSVSITTIPSPSPNTDFTIVTPANAPSVLGNAVALLGSLDASKVPYAQGAFGICQTITVPAAAPDLSMYVWEGGEYYDFDNLDQEAAIFGSFSGSTASTLDEYLFAEQNCYLDVNAGWGATATATNGCAYGTYSGASPNWFQGGFWSPRGPYNLSAYAGTSVTIFIGNWSYYADTISKYSQFMYVGNVQMTASGSFPTSGPLAKGRSLGTVRLTHKTAAAVKPTH